MPRSLALAAAIHSQINRGNAANQYDQRKISDQKGPEKWSGRPFDFAQGAPNGALVGATGFEPATPCAQDTFSAFSCDFLRFQIQSN